MGFLRWMYRAIRVVGVLAVGVVVMMYLVRTKPRAESAPRDERGALVQVVKAVPRSERFTIEAQGTVEPKRVANVVAEIGGRIVDKAPTFEEGARFEAGDLLVQIDPEDMRLKIQQLEGQIEQSRAEISQLDAERQNTEALRAISAREVALAKRESDRAQTLLSKGTIAQEEADRREKSYLQAHTLLQNHENTLRVWPERVRLQRAKLAVAEASLNEAKRNLERTSVRAPFAGRLETTDVEVGEVVQPGGRLARLWDDSVVEVRVNLQQDDVRWIIPNPETEEAQSWIAGALELENEIPDWVPRANVSYTVGTQAYNWSGFVRAFGGQVEQQTRTVPLIIEVRNPKEAVAPGDPPPLMPGMFSRVAIEGGVVEGVYAIPRDALQLDGTVWVAEEGRLQRRNVIVVRALGSTVYVASPVGVSATVTEGANPVLPLKAGDQIVVSQLAVPVEGMPVRLQEAEVPGERTTTSL